MDCDLPFVRIKARYGEFIERTCKTACNKPRGRTTLTPKGGFRVGTQCR
jgi:hypothetical protein